MEVKTGFKDSPFERVQPPFRPASAAASPRHHVPDHPCSLACSHRPRAPFGDTPEGAAAATRTRRQLARRIVLGFCPVCARASRIDTEVPIGDRRRPSRASIPARVAQRCRRSKHLAARGRSVIPSRTPRSPEGRGCPTQFLVAGFQARFVPPPPFPTALAAYPSPHFPTCFSRYRSWGLFRRTGS
jgi:hypothetical protein